MSKVKIEFTGLPEVEKKPAESSPLKERVIYALRNVFDPELPVNVYDLKLIYDIRIDSHNKVDIDMTLTNPNCPVADQIPKDVEDGVRKVDGITDVSVTMVWEPTWHKDMLSDDIKLELGLL
ncbi:MAG: iron-sulfur cluster assembly protein [Alphaproteobacteria bacterium]|nr:iron-sulfur cluster assembly protein [Alphaproteobacteria bacterium]